jgi:predicted nuclease with TOPRIM domain
MDETIYKLLLWALPILLAVLGFIGALAVNSLMNMSKDINEIKISLKEVSTKHENLEERIERLEDKIFA